jgi:hypothetical protein
MSAVISYGSFLLLSIIINNPKMSSRTPCLKHLIALLGRLRLPSTIPSRSSRAPCLTRLSALLERLVTVTVEEINCHEKRLPFKWEPVTEPVTE